jgi:hypothetical protein
LQEEGEFMARPQHSPTRSRSQAPATPLESRTKPKPEEKHLCRRWTKKIPPEDPEVLVQACRIRPISDRSPQSNAFGETATQIAKSAPPNFLISSIGFSINVGSK